MKWLRRADDARRTKGDPPPSVDQLLATVKQQGEIMRNLRHQCDGLIAENARLRSGGICGDEAPRFLGCTSMRPVCQLLYGHASEWHEGDDGSRWRKARGATEDSTDDPPPPVYDVGYLSLPLETQRAIEKEWAERADPAVTRPYIPTYEAEVPDNDPWKDGLR